MEDYTKLLNLMCDCARQMPERIERDIKVTKKPKQRYIFVLAYEAFKGMELCCLAFDIQAFSQTSTLMRQIIEQVATFKVLCDYPNCLELYATLHKLRKKFLQNDSSNVIGQAKDSIELQELMKDIPEKRRDSIRFLQSGWILGAETNNYSIEEIFKKSKLDQFINWRKHYNEFVHTNLSIGHFVPEGVTVVANENIYNLGFLFYELMRYYHELTDFDFIFDKDYNKEFRALFSCITEKLTVR